MKTYALLLVLALFSVAFTQEELVSESTELPEGILAGGWVPLNWAEAGENAEIVELLDFGLNYVLNEAFAEGFLSSEAGWELLEVDSLEAQVVDGTNYDFDVTIVDNAGEIADADFIVWDRPAPETPVVAAYAVSNAENP